MEFRLLQQTFPMGAISAAHRCVAAVRRGVLPMLALALVLAQPVQAQTKPNVDQRLDRVRSELNQIEATLKRTDLSDEMLLGLRHQLEPMSVEVEEVIADVAPHRDAVKSRVEQLAPAVIGKPKTDASAAGAIAGALPGNALPAGAPVEAAPAKPPTAAAPATPSAVVTTPAISPDVTTKKDDAAAAVTSELARQQKLFDDLSAIVQRARALSIEIVQTIKTVDDRRREIFTRTLFARSSSLMSPSLWHAALIDLPGDVRAFQTLFHSWTDNVRAHLQGASLLLLVLLAGTLLGLVPLTMGVVSRVLVLKPLKGEPDRLHKAMAGLGVAMVIACVPVAFLFGANLLIEGFALSNTRIQPFFSAFAGDTLLVTLVIATGRAVLSPGRPRWRLLAVSDPIATMIARLTVVLALVLAISHLLIVVCGIIFSDVAVIVIIRGMGALICALMIGRVLLVYGSDADAEPEVDPQPLTFEQSIAGPLRLVLWCILLVIFGALVFGYIAFAAALAEQIVWVASVLGVTYLLYILSQEGLAAGMNNGSPMNQALVVGAGIRRETLAQISVSLAGLMHLALYAFGAFLILAPWGFQSNDFFGRIGTSFLGFHIGDISISPVKIVTSVILLLVTIALTRGLQRWLDTKFLPHTQLDKGLRNSIRTSLGYLGFTMAVALALSDLGVSFERLAIVAGALSVGIGFGLQSIVNNFVSGLILLWERAIRVGDWIVVGEDQGYVRRINVRSTEIETFERLTVIVPNSNLVSGVVKNWVRGDRIGRVKISLSLRMATNVEQVRDLLISAAKANEQVLRIPAPTVIFTDISEIAVKLDLLCYVDDVETAARVRSELLFDLHHRFTDLQLIDLLTPLQRAIVMVEPADGLSARQESHITKIAPRESRA